MKTKTLSDGTFPDVAIHAGRVWCVLQRGTSIDIGSFDLDTLEERSFTSWDVGPDTIFAKLYAHEGRLWLAYREGRAPYRIVLREIGTGLEERIAIGHGMHPVIFGAGDLAWQGSGAPLYEVWRRPLTSGLPKLVRRGAPTGLSRTGPGDLVITADEDRFALAGYTQPHWSGALVVAEGPQGGAYARLRDRELTIWPSQIANTPRCAMAEDHLVLVAWGGPQKVAFAVFAYGEMHPIGDSPIAPLDRKAFVGGFYVTTDKYQEVVRDFPQNVEVVVEASAIARASTPVIVPSDALSGVSDPSKVIGLYVAAEEDGHNSASHLDLAAELARAAWRQRFPSHPVPAVVGYVTPGMRTRPTWPPRSVDVFAPECYFDASPSEPAFAQLLARWTDALPATRPWLLIGQLYDRNGTQRDRMPVLAAMLSAYLDALRARPWILGILWFAVQRPGGVRDYPALLAAHRRIFDAVPGAPAGLPVAVPPEPPPIDPGEPSVIRIAVGSYDKTVRAGDGAGIRFELQSDVPVTSLTVDFLGDGKEGLTLASTDMRGLRGVTVAAPTKGGRFDWQLTAINARGERDQTGASRALTVQE